MIALAAIDQAAAFSTIGPALPYQTPTLDYITRYYYGNEYEPGGPQPFGDGARLNVPIITYAYDVTFLNFFGAKGVAAVDAAMTLLNRLPAASAAHLASFNTQGNQEINYTAQALELTDLKSTVMSIMMEHMGLMGETHVWDLIGRDPQTGTCNFAYFVINDNYDSTTYNPSAYVNGVQYTYNIVDFCPDGVSVADAIETTADAASSANYSFTAVATLQALQPGGYYLGLSRDDMGGLAYLYRSHRFEYEGTESNTIATPFISAYVPVNPFASNVITSGFNGTLGGVEKITYVKVAYDSLIGPSFIPRIYTYQVPWVTNSQLRTLTFTRTINRPDIIFTAGDLVSNNLAQVTYSEYTRGFSYISNNFNTVGDNGVTAQVIAPEEIVTFNTITPVYINETPAYLDQSSLVGYPELLWGSFDGTTNTPIVYPNQSSIDTLEAQVLEGNGYTLPGTFNPVTIYTNVLTTAVSGTVTQTQ